MIFSEKRYFNEPKVMIAEEVKEARFQERIQGVKLADRKFYCEKKITDTCKHFFHGRSQFGAAGVDADGKHYVQIFSLNLDIKSKLAGLCSDKAWHEFLNRCYNQVLEIYELRLAASKAAVKSDQDFGKFREDALKTLEKNLSEMRADQRLLQNQKANKPRLPFDQNDFKTWSSLSFEDAQDSKARLVETKVTLLKKINE